MKLPIILSLVLVMTALQGCSDKENTLLSTFQDESFMFGYYNDFSTQGYSKIFLIQDGKLYPDAMGRFQNPPLFNAIPLSDELYQKALPARDQFPQTLLTNADESFGCPGCVDQGILYIAKEVDGEMVYWHLDPQTSAMPEALQAYGVLLQLVLEQLPE